MGRFLAAVLGVLPVWYRERPNYVRLVFDPTGLRPFIVNWAEVARALLDRMHREAAAVGPDPCMQALLGELLSFPGIPRRWSTPDLGAQPSVVIPMHVSKGEVDLRLFSTVTTVGSPRDITVQELRIECFIPADDLSERAIEALS